LDQVIAIYIILTQNLAVRFKIFLTADEPFPNTFAEEVRLLFASLVGINETRVTPVVQPKRSVEQSTDLELELQVAPPESQSEPTAEQAVQDFVEEQLGNFNSQLGGLPDAPANVTTRGGLKTIHALFDICT
jgi:hypothetical protein